MLGREENEFILSAGSSHFTWREAFMPLLLVDGDTALALSDGEEHQRRRRLVQPAFHLHRVNGYLDVIIDGLDSTIDGWSPGSVVDVWAEFRAAVRRIVSGALFGRGIGARHVRDARLERRGAQQVVDVVAEEDHGRLRAHLTQRRRRGVAQGLDDLRQWRNECDYVADLGSVDFPKLMANALASAHHVINALPPPAGSSP